MRGLFREYPSGRLTHSVLNRDEIKKCIRLDYTPNFNTAMLDDDSEHLFRQRISVPESAFRWDLNPYDTSRFGVLMLAILRREGLIPEDGKRLCPI